jgi:tetratricopeptide (TPR) repeat protein
MKRRSIFKCFVFALALGAQLSVLAQAGQENRPQPNAPCTSKLEVACEQVRMGVEAYREAKFAEAEYHFRNAAEMDSNFLEARLYLGTALAQQYIPGGESPENLRVANQAIAAFDAVLKLDAKNATALASVAVIYYNMKQFDKAKEYQRRRIDLEPANPEPYYWIGVLDWAQCFPRQMHLRQDLKLDFPHDPEKPGMLPPLPKDARARLASENGAAVEEGLQNLEKALERKADDRDAMVYLNLLYRQKADLEVEEGARQNDLRIAQEWVDKALAIARKQTSPPSDQQGPQQ